MFPPTAGWPTAVVTGPQDPADRHWGGFQHQPDSTHAELGKDSGICLAMDGPQTDAGSSKTHIVTYHFYAWL